MGDITLKFKLKNEFNKLIDEDMSSSLKLVTKSNTYSPEYEQDSIYSFIVPDTEKLLSFHINIDNEDYISIISNTPYNKKSYRSIIGNFINKTNIPSIYAFHKSAQYAITELNVYHLDDNLNKLFNDDYERYFYKSGSFIELELKLKDDKVVDVDQIQWGIISWHDLYSIERESKHDSLSSEYSSSIQEKLINKFTDISKEVISKEKNRYIYKLPNYQQNEPHELYLFTYISKDEITKYNSVKLCINDYTQVVIDVTLAEALRAETEVAQLGWATSYVLQRLWHDNPSDAKEINELLLKNKNDVIKVTKNNQMKNIITNIVPDIDIKMLSKEYIDYGMHYIFYTTLGWYEFYKKFPIIQDVEKDIVNIQDKYTDTLETYNKKIIYNSNVFDYVLNNNMYNFFYMFKLHKDIYKLNASDELRLIPEQFVYQKSQDSNNCFIYNSAPVYINNFQLSFYEFNDIEYGYHSLNEENIALYSVTGKFIIYYTPSNLKIESINRADKLIKYKIQYFVFYVYDAFDFNDNICQFVGSWDYKLMEFNRIRSRKSLLIDKLSDTDSIDSCINNVYKNNVDYSKIDIYNIYYQRYKDNVNKGFDFTIYTDKSVKVENKTVFWEYRYE